MPSFYCKYYSFMIMVYRRLFFLVSFSQGSVRIIMIISLVSFSGCNISNTFNLYETFLTFDQCHSGLILSTKAEIFKNIHKEQRDLDRVLSPKTANSRKCYVLCYNVEHTSNLIYFHKSRRTLKLLATLKWSLPCINIRIAGTASLGLVWDKRKNEQKIFQITSPFTFGLFLGISLVGK